MFCRMCACARAYDPGFSSPPRHGRCVAASLQAGWSEWRAPEDGRRAFSLPQTRALWISPSQKLAREAPTARRNRCLSFTACSAPHGTSSGARLLPAPPHRAPPCARHGACARASVVAPSSSALSPTHASCAAARVVVESHAPGGSWAGSLAEMLERPRRIVMPDLRNHGDSAHSRSMGCGVPPPPSPSRTKWTRRVPHPVLIGHAASLTPY